MMAQGQRDTSAVDVPPQPKRGQSPCTASTALITLDGPDTVTSPNAHHAAAFSSAPVSPAAISTASLTASPQAASVTAPSGRTVLILPHVAELESPESPVSPLSPSTPAPPVVEAKDGSSDNHGSVPGSSGQQSGLAASSTLGTAHPSLAVTGGAGGKSNPIEKKKTAANFRPIFQFNEHFINWFTHS